MTPWLIAAAIYGVLFLAFALANAAHTSDDEHSCPPPDDRARFDAIVRNWDDGVSDVRVIVGCFLCAFVCCAIALALP